MWDNTVRPLLPERVRVKSFVIDPDSGADRKAVSEYIKPEHLPASFGGRCEAWPPPNATVPQKKAAKRLF